MKKLLVLPVFALLASLAVAQTPKAMVPVIHIVSDVWPPFVTGDPDRPGVDVEVMLAVFDRLEVRVEFELYPWKRALARIEAGRTDAILDIFATPERREWLWFPDTYFSENTSALFCHRCDPQTPVTASELAGRSLVVNRGYQYDRLFDNPAIKKHEVSSFAQGFHMLELGRADYYIINRDVGMHTLKAMQLADIAPLAVELDDPSPTYLGFAKKSYLRPLVDAFDKELARFKRDRGYRTILRKYGLARNRDKTLGREVTGALCCCRDNATMAGCRH